MLSACGAFDGLAEQVGVTGVTCGLLDHVQQDPAQIESCVPPRRGTAAVRASSEAIEATASRLRSHACSYRATRSAGSSSTAVRKSQSGSSTKSRYHAAGGSPSSTRRHQPSSTTARCLSSPASVRSEPRWWCSADRDRGRESCGGLSHAGSRGIASAVCARHRCSPDRVVPFPHDTQPTEHSPVTLVAVCTMGCRG